MKRLDKLCRAANILKYFHKLHSFSFASAFIFVEKTKRNEDKKDRKNFKEFNMRNKNIKSMHKSLFYGLIHAQMFLQPFFVFVASLVKFATRLEDLFRET